MCLFVSSCYLSALYYPFVFLLLGIQHAMYCPTPWCKQKVRVTRCSLRLFFRFTSPRGGCMHACMHACMHVWMGLFVCFLHACRRAMKKLFMQCMCIFCLGVQTVRLHRLQPPGYGGNAELHFLWAVCCHEEDGCLYFNRERKRSGWGCIATCTYTRRHN